MNRKQICQSINTFYQFRQCSKNTKIVIDCLIINHVFTIKKYKNMMQKRTPSYENKKKQSVTLNYIKRSIKNTKIT